MQLIYKGAEAEIHKHEYLGLPCVIKKRLPKKYKIREIDDKLRKERIRKEALNLVKAKKAIKAPHIYNINLQEKSITMEYVQGDKLKNVIDKKPGLGRVIGETVKQLHTQNIVHSDLTTSNMILNPEGLYLIDFGLAQHSKKDEDKAVDLLVFKNMLKSTHHKSYEKIWEAFSKAYKNPQIMRKVEEIEKRARYK